MINVVTPQYAGSDWFKNFSARENYASAVCVERESLKRSWLWEDENWIRDDGMTLLWNEYFGSGSGKGNGMFFAR